MTICNSRDSEDSTSTAKGKQAKERKNDSQDPVRTIYRHICPSRSPTTSTSSTEASGLTPIATSSVDPVIPGIAALPKADPDAPAAFFATSAGHGTIAGIALASAALTILLVCVVLWRRKQTRDSGVIKVDSGGKAGLFGFGRSRASAASSISSFGGSSDNLAGVAYEDHASDNDQRLAAERQEMTETLAGGAAGRSFFVESRNRSVQPSSHGHGSHEGYSGSSNGHDPFSDPSSSGHDHSTEGYLVAAGAVGAKRRHERKRSGYTADTYRRKSRPVSDKYIMPEPILTSSIAICSQPRLR